MGDASRRTCPRRKFSRRRIATSAEGWLRRGRSVTAERWMEGVELEFRGGQVVCTVRGAVRGAASFLVADEFLGIIQGLVTNHDSAGGYSRRVAG